MPILLDRVFSGKTVWLSGHTGFKGSWLAHWLCDLGAAVHGFSLPPATAPSLFDQLGLAQRVTHQIGDLRDGAQVLRSIRETQPDFVFHLGAQAIVRMSFDEPAEYRPPPPDYGYLWVDGYWDWTGYDWSWSNGYWSPSRPGYVFVGPRYIYEGGRPVYYRGYWQGSNGYRDYHYTVATQPTWRGTPTAAPALGASQARGPPACCR